MKKYNYGKGWFNESKRHSLARQGIKTGRKINYSLQNPINYGRQLSSKEFSIDDNTTIVCRSEKTSYGFRHLCDLYKNGELVDSAKATYYNRTWESFEFESAIRNLLDKVGMSKEEKETVMDKITKRAHTDTASEFKSIGMVASLGEVFGKTLKEKNDWKLRMIKAGLGDKGFQVPEDWDKLSEKEKGERLDKIIKHMRETKINMAKKSKGVKITSKNLVNYIMEYEGGNMTMKEYFSFFGYLIKTGQVWHLQGMYGREASRLINGSLISKDGKVNWDEIKDRGIDLNTKFYEE